jgi:replication factor A1
MSTKIFAPQQHSLLALLSLSFCYYIPQSIKQLILIWYLLRKFLKLKMSLSVANGSEFSNISEINSDKAAWDVKVKIIRLWQVSDFNRSALPFSIEMVLLDANGDRIHATVKKTLIYKFKDQILEGKIYALQNVGVSNNGGAYRTTRHPYKMNFLFNTFVQRISNFDISKSPFHFVPISEIVGGSYDTDYLCG